MGFTNGQHDKPSTTGKVEKVKKGIGLKLTQTTISIYKTRD